MAEDTISDHNGIGALLMMSYVLKTLKLVIIIFNVSYFLGMAWHIIAEYSMYLIEYI